MGIPKGEQIRFNADFWRSAVNCDALRDDQWERLEAFVPGERKGKRGPRTNNRRFLNALLWMARRESLARSAQAVGQARGGEAALLPDRDGRSGRDPCRVGARGRSRMADDRLDDRAGASARRRRSPAKRGPVARGLGR